MVMCRRADGAKGQDATLVHEQCTHCHSSASSSTHSLILRELVMFFSPGYVI